MNIYPQEAEDLLVTHPKVLDAAVFGIPDAEMGQSVKGVVQTVDPKDATEGRSATSCWPGYGTDWRITSVRGPSRSNRSYPAPTPASLQAGTGQKVLGDNGRSAVAQWQAVEPEGVRGEDDLRCALGGELEVGDAFEPLLDDQREFHACEMGAKTAVRSAAETPVSVHFSVHHHVVGGDFVTVITIDRGQAQPHPGVRRQRDAADRDGVGGHARHDRSRRFQSDDFLDENLDFLRVSPQCVPELRVSCELQHRQSHRRGDGVQPGEDE